MVAIALNLHWNVFDIAVRDSEIALAALVLAGVPVGSQRRSAQPPRTKCTRGLGTGDWGHYTPHVQAKNAVVATGRLAQ
jgi:hypothetical protein